MKHRMKFLVVAIAAIVSLVGVVTIPTSVQAACTPSETQKCCGDVPISIDIGTCEVGERGVLFAYLTLIIRFIAGLVGIAVAGVIIFGGLMYMTARGDKGQAEKAIGVIRNGIISLIVFIFLAAIINFLIPGGLLGGESNGPPQGGEGTDPNPPSTIREPRPL